MTDTKLIDSSIWLNYLINANHKTIIESSDILLLSSLSLFEIKKKLMKSKISEENISKSLGFVKKRGFVIPVNEKISEDAANVSIKNNLAAVDAIIYTTAKLNNAQLLTLDNDFRGIGGVEIL